MAYLENALFNIKLQGGNKTFNHRYSQFEEIMTDFANSNFLEFLPEFEHPFNTPFFEKLKFYQTFLKSNQFESMTPSIKDDSEYWKNVIGYAECSNPYEVFIIAQLAHFISKRLDLDSIVFGIGCEDKFTRIICLINGKTEWTHEEIMEDDEQENEDCFQMTLEELDSLFSLIDSTIYPKIEKIIEEEVNNQSDVKIGFQVWMSKNLDVDRFRNGDLIPHIESDEEWEEAGINNQPAWCYYDNNPKNGEIYGKLYNSHAVNDPRGLAPEGWNIPDNEEWLDLIILLGGKEYSGGKMKSKTKWNSPNYGELNISGFNALPGGTRDGEGEFYNLHNCALFSCKRTPDKIDIFLQLFYNKARAERILFYPSSFGASVRCIKFNSNIPFEEEHEIENKENKNLEVSIGDETWMTHNLDVDRFRNGDLIPHIESDEEWEEAGKNNQPAWCYYDNNPKNGEIYGKLYNWYAVNDSRGLAPEGWLIAGEEWENLSRVLGNETTAGGRMKSRTLWNSPNIGATNVSGFSALAAGYRNDESKFESLGDNALFWSSIDENYDDSDCAVTFGLQNDIIRLSFDMENKSVGASVRCIKDLNLE